WRTRVAMTAVSAGSKPARAATARAIPSPAPRVLLRRNDAPTLRVGTPSPLRGDAGPFGAV
ncbi:hypothetical protein AB0B42_09250, partial [Streptomyces fradiae]|uniref:hypothetical protein n=1 Tax=Streptomyces fradiae TaxID=1906 RepID=UPI0033E834BE